MFEKFVNGSIVAFQGTSPNSRAAHPGQESPGNEGKNFVIISVLLTTAGIPTLSMAYLSQTVTPFWKPSGEPSPVSF